MKRMRLAAVFDFHQYQYDLLGADLGSPGRPVITERSWSR